MLFFELLQIALGHRQTLSRIPTTEEWKTLFQLSQKQALLGIMYRAIEVLPTEQRPPREIILRWCLHAERIKERNIELNTKIVDITQRFRNDGFRNIILKGQGIAQYYNIDKLELYRTPGDVDIWFDGSRKEIATYVRQHKHDCEIVYHHVDFPETDGVHIEVHFTPSWMNCYFTNKRLQRYFDQNRETLLKTDSDIPVPNVEFNRVYILIHIYRHLFHEGIGLRQLMDYYYVLRQGFSENDRVTTLEILHSLKMERFTSAVMWVLQHVFGMADSHLLTTPNEKDGRFLLSEIMIAGNLGLHDKRIAKNRNESNLSHGLRKVKRNFRFIFSYPSEVLWSPIFKAWHYLWRRKINKNY